MSLAKPVVERDITATVGNQEKLLIHHTLGITISYSECFCAFATAKQHFKHSLAPPTFSQQGCKIFKKRKHTSGCTKDSLASCAQTLQ